jgi:folate-binding protein YgfZ
MDATLAPLPLSGLFRFRGPDARRFCNGMFTNNVRDLPTGGGHRTAMCDAKGRLLGLADLYATADDAFLVAVEGWERASFLAHYGKYIVLDDVELDDLTDDLAVVTVQGADAETALIAHGVAVPGPVHTSTGPEGQLVTGFSWHPSGDFGVARRDRCGRGGFDVYAPAAAIATLHDLPPRSPEIAEAERVALGEVRWPNDMPVRLLLHELGLRDRVCSFEKGCYIGQEVVHRIDVMGQLRRALVGVRADAAFASGAEVIVGDEVVGRVTSPAAHPRLGHIGLAVVRKPNDTAGLPIVLRWEGGETTGLTATLPMP